MKRVFAAILAVCLMIGMGMPAVKVDAASQLSAMAARGETDVAYMTSLIDFIMAKKDTLASAKDSELLLYSGYLRIAIELYYLEMMNASVGMVGELKDAQDLRDKGKELAESLDKAVAMFLNGEVTKEKLAEIVIGLTEIVQKGQQEVVKFYDSLKEKGSASTMEEHTPTNGEKNALAAAKQYLSVMSFSYSGLVKQLKFSGYSDAEATYAVEHCGANWNEQAVAKAKQYLALMAFSRDGLVKQLVFDGFTQSQAEYGVAQVY